MRCVACACAVVFLWAMVVTTYLWLSGGSPGYAVSAVLYGISAGCWVCIATDRKEKS